MKLSTNNRMVILAAIWSLIFGVFYLEYGIEEGVSPNPRYHNSVLPLIFAIGILTIAGSLYIIFGHKKGIKYLFFSAFILLSLFALFLLLLPHNSGTWVILYFLYFFLGIVFSSISIVKLSKS